MSESTAPAAKEEAVPQETKLDESETAQDASPEDLRAQADKLIAEGKKAIALKQWEDGAAKYADALDLMRQLVGEFDPVMAPLLLSYGKALYELAFSQAGVMGKEEVEKQAGGEAMRAEEEGAPGNFVFSADPASDDEADDGGDAGASGDAGPSTAAAGGGGDDEGGEGEGEDEPEDDYNAAWEVLDVARTIYTKTLEGKAEGEMREERLNLAECYLALGDVSCETENFPQAVQDYSSALEIKSALLPASSRSLASVHYQLATVLEFTPNRRQDALSHVETALSGFKARLAELSQPNGEVSDEVKKLSSKEKEKETDDVKGLIADLEVKIEELKAAPPAEDFVSESINHLLGSGFGSDAIGSALERAMGGASGSGSGAGFASGSGSGSAAPVNDLTSMVKKKPKKVPVQPVQANGGDKGKEVEGQTNGVKRSAEGEGETAEKKAKVA